METACAEEEFFHVSFRNSHSTEDAMKEKNKTNNKYRRFNRAALDIEFKCIKFSINVN